MGSIGRLRLRFSSETWANLASFPIPTPVAEKGFEVLYKRGDKTRQPIRVETRADGDHDEGLSPPVGPLDILPECVFQLSLNLITFFCLRGILY